jgi:2-polyprenyl-3-methyl-5-hydroxy-6-metoxy-1,4-benzoquinol methylase
MNVRDTAAVENLTERQRREIEYHRKRAEQISLGPPTLDCIEEPNRRPWNSYWSLYDQIRDTDLRERRILIPGCGFGADVIRLSALGAQVYGSDISPESIALAKQRASQMQLEYPPQLQVMTCEQLDYPDQFFDGVLLMNILHHVDIPRTMAELKRVCKPGAMVAVREPYTSRQLQAIRQSWLIDKVMHPTIRDWFYAGKTYITDDERKLDQSDLRFLQQSFPNMQIRFFDIVNNRLLPKSILVSKVDHAVCRRLPLALQAFLGSVLVGFSPLQCEPEGRGGS